MKIILSFLFLTLFNQCWSWDFGLVGEALWGANCGGCAQSPIDLDIDTVKNQTFAATSYMNYSVVPTNDMTLTLGYRSLRLTLDASEVDRTIRDGGLEDEFKFAYIEFKWGDGDTKGSDHRIKGKQFPAEIQLVHYNSKYASFDAAKDIADGLAAVAVLVEVDDDAASTDLDGLFTSIDDFGTLAWQDDSTSTETTSPFALSKLLPSNTANFYLYGGSQTTPDCNEAVLWTVLEDTLKVSASQIAKLRTLRQYNFFNIGDKAITNIFRNVQNVGTREVYYRKNGFLGLGLFDIVKSFFGIGGVFPTA